MTVKLLKRGLYNFIPLSGQLFEPANICQGLDKRISHFSRDKACSERASQCGTIYSAIVLFP